MPGQVRAPDRLRLAAHGSGVEPARRSSSCQDAVSRASSVITWPAARPRRAAACRTRTGRAVAGTGRPGAGGGTGSGAARWRCPAGAGRRPGAVIRRRRALACGRAGDHVSSPAPAARGHRVPRRVRSGGCPGCSSQNDRGYPPPAFRAAARAQDRNWSSLKERCRVKGGFAGFWRLDWACVTGVSCFPDSCHVRGERLGGSRTGRSPAAGGGAGGVLEATGRELDDLAAGNGSRGRLRGYSVAQVRPHVPGYPVRAVPLAAVIPSCVPGRAGGHGAGPRQRGGQAGSIRWAPCRLGAGGRLVGGLAPGPLARALVMRPGPAESRADRRGSWTGSGPARRASRRRPG